MSSQFGEHVRIMEYFAGRKGTFLDVGAYDGITFSNTYELYRAGWTGVLVEPSPEAFCRLKKAYPNNAELICAMLVPSGSGIACLLESECYPVSTAVPAHYEKFKQFPHRPITVGIFSWEEMKQRHEHFDFVNIDTEGTNYEVLKSMPYRPDMLCVEVDPAEGIHDYKLVCMQFGLPNHQNIGGNLLAWK